MGCVYIYTAQGFEFDYGGVIFGTDLVYRHGQGWVGQPQHSHDKPVKRSGLAFDSLVKNTYRVLLTRGLRGCFLCFLDKETEQFVRGQVEKGTGHVVTPATHPAHAVLLATKSRCRFRLVGLIGSA